MVRRLAPPLVALVVSGCFVDSGGGEASLTATDAATGTTTTTTTTATTTTTTTGATAGTSTTTTTSASGDPTTTGPATTTLATDTAATTEATTTGTTSPDPTTGGPAGELLLHADPEACVEPLWCFLMGDISQGSPARIWAQECYTSALQGPLVLTELRYTIAALFGDLADTSPMIEVYTREADGPGALIDARGLDVAALALGQHVVALEPPIDVEGPSFCVGLVVGPENAETNAGVGIAAAGEATPTESYLKMKGRGACLVPEFTDIAALKPVPTAHWCIGVQAYEGG